MRSAAGVATFDARSADAVAIGLLPSRGMQFHGFEINFDRWDWQRELTEKGKADVIGDHCDYWWLVTAGSIARVEELPLVGASSSSRRQAQGGVGGQAAPAAQADHPGRSSSLWSAARADAEKAARAVAAKLMLEERKKAGLR